MPLRHDKALHVQGIKVIPANSRLIRTEHRVLLGVDPIVTRNNKMRHIVVVERNEEFMIDCADQFCVHAKTPPVQAKYLLQT